MSKYFNIAVDLARSLKRDNTIYSHETPEQNATVPKEIAYTGPLDKEGRIPYESIEHQMDREAQEDRECGGYGSNRKRAFDALNEYYGDDEE